MTAPDSTIIAAFGTAFSGLTSAIVIMWRKLSREHQLLQARADKCESDREVMHGEIGELREKVGLIENCPARSCPYTRHDVRTSRIPISSTQTPTHPKHHP